MLSGNPDIKIFAGSSGLPFAKKMCNYLGAELGASEVIHFSDGNIFIRIKETVRDKDVYVCLLYTSKRLYGSLYKKTT